ncbi:MAG TPA: hypothetical protein VFQ45_17780 [Longimicrobium sp.]|nr:hypothetical protein [Longimicrobium sp.]
MPDHRIRVVDALVDLSDEYREVLRPGEAVRCRDGRVRRLPRFFYEFPSWDAAKEADLAPDFKAWEFLDVDVREHRLLRMGDRPRYLPLATALLAAQLQLLRDRAGTYVHISANGGYRSPSHRLSGQPTPHNWGAAANLYRIGDDWLDEGAGITRYAELARELSPAFRALPFGNAAGQTDDHLHLDVGYVTVVPHDRSDEDQAEPPREEPRADANDGAADGAGNEE